MNITPFKSHLHLCFRPPDKTEAEPGQQMKKSVQSFAKIWRMQWALLVSHKRLRVRVGKTQSSGPLGSGAVPPVWASRHSEVQRWAHSGKAAREFLSLPKAVFFWALLEIYFRGKPTAVCVQGPKRKNMLQLLVKWIEWVYKCHSETIDLCRRAFHRWRGWLIVSWCQLIITWWRTGLY